MQPKRYVNLASDNVSPAATEILAALSRVNTGSVPSYGKDPESAALKENFSELFGQEVWVMPVSTGTAANALALSAMTPPYGRILSTDLAHIEVAECGAVELFSAGAKIMLVPSSAGKMSAELLDRVVAKSGLGKENRSQASVVSITVGTERGTVYSVEELAAIGNVAKKNKLYFHMDGARLANAVAHLDVPVRDITAGVGVDALSFGATKNGGMNAEAIVIFNREIYDDLRFRYRRAGQQWSKMRFAAAQLNAYVEDELWLRLGKKANDSAKSLAEGLSLIKGIKLLEAVEINILLCEIPEKIASGMSADGIEFSLSGEGIRFVTSWSTTPEEIAYVIERAEAHARAL